MKIVSIISEFNPFHFGHKWLIDNIKSKFSAYVVAIMSGNFVQRGEPAIISKEIRAQIAVLGGVDLVLEIPAIWSISTAEKFASAGIFFAESLGCVDYLGFGSECGDTDILLKILDIFKTYEFKEQLKKNLKTGVTFARAQELAVNSISTELSDALKHPNNILGIEYLKSLKNIKPITFKRNENFASSSKIRKLALNSENFENLIPDFSYDFLENSKLKSLEKFEKQIFYKFITCDKSELNDLSDISEGIENRIKKMALNSKNLNEFLCAIKTKRYTMARIKRIILCATLGIDKNIQQSNPSYLKVLASNENGYKILKKAKQVSTLPIISRKSDYKKLSKEAKNIFDKELIIDKLYAST